ncbi:MAG: hypothetical protein WC243_03370 [Patescibacteria group bacterium]|jgi:hypothetical protein
MKLKIALVLVLVFSLVVISPVVLAYLSGETKTIEAKAISDHECDDEVLHFVITGNASEELTPRSIHVEWAGGYSEDVFWSGTLTGGVAHYTTTSHLDLAVSGATAVIYKEWDGQFNLSHGPCFGSPTPTNTPVDTVTPTKTPSGTITPTKTPSVTCTPRPSETPVTTPTPGSDSKRTDIPVILQAGWANVTATMWVGGTEVQTLLFAPVPGSENQAVLFTLWLDEPALVTIRVSIPEEYLSPNWILIRWDNSEFCGFTITDTIELTVYPGQDVTDVDFQWVDVINWDHKACLVGK